jgi:hypothetical protein
MIKGYCDGCGYVVDGQCRMYAQPMKGVWNYGCVHSCYEKEPPKKKFGRVGQQKQRKRK